MIKRLISFLLTLVLFIAIPLEARYRYNPYTRKLDWYEAAGDITLGDIGDITLTGLATGNILYYNGTAWVNLATGANAEVLTLAGGIPSWAAGGAPAAHAASHLAAGADSVDHDLLLNYLAAQHLTLPSTIVAVLTDHDLAAHTALGLFDASADVDHNLTTNYLAAQHLTLPSTIVAVLTDHNAAAHVALGFLALPDTIANVLSDHNLLAHTALGLFDQSSDVDHNATTNWVANKHINWTAAADNFSTSENFTLAWDDAADYAEIVQMNAAGIADRPLININDDRTGVTADTVGEATIVMNAAGTYAFYIQTGQAYFAADTTQIEDVFMTWADAADHMVITQNSEDGIEDQPLIKFTDDREGATANELSEATLVFETAGTYALNVALGQSYFQDDTTQIENVEIQWDDAADHMTIYQGSATQTEGQALVSITSEAEGTTVDENNEALLALRTETELSWGLWVSRGKAEFTDDFLINWATALDRMVITQSAVAGTEDQPLIYIDDDRVGATVDEVGEATLVIESAGTYSTYFKDGTVFFAFAAVLESLSDISSTTKLWAKDNAWITWGTLNDWFSDWDNNGGGDDLLVFVAQNYGADDTRALWWSNLNPSGMTDHDNYLSPTFVLTNDEGADVNDYSGVVIGERGQANVKVAHYFDFYAMTGAADGSVATADELPAIFRFGANGTGVPGYSTAGGDVLMEGALEIDGNQQNAGYNRYDYIYWIESFDHGIAANRYSQMWDITSLNTQGNGTNTIDTTPSHITLTTDNNAVGDNEGTITYKQIILRSRLNRSEFSVDLGQTANTQFYMGWNTSQTNAMVAAADEYVIVFFDVSDNANWQIKVGDGATEDVFTSAVAADTNDIRHEIWVESDGTVHWRVNGTELDITGTVDNLMTANGHYLIVCQAQSVTGAAAIVAEMCYIENEKTKSN